MKNERKVFVTSGSETSAQAAASMERRVDVLENLVFEAITRAGPRGLADFEIDQLLAGHLAPGATARPRRCRLRDGDIIRDTGETVLNPETNRRATLWALSIHVPDEVFYRIRAEKSRTSEEREGSKPKPPLRSVARENFPGSVESILTQLVEHFDLIRLTPDLGERERLQRLEGRLENARAYVSRSLDRLRLESEWKNQGQSGFNFTGEES